MSIIVPWKLNIDGWNGIITARGGYMNKDEYLMLREEILNNSNMENNTINFFYATAAAILAFSIDKSDSLYILISYVVIIPAYLIVRSKRRSICKIGAYLKVFHEGNEFNWETRSCELYKGSEKSYSSKIQSTNYPFLFVSTFVMGLFFVKTDWSTFCNDYYEIFKVIVALILYSIQISLIIKYKKITVEDFESEWDRVKNKEQ